MNSASSFREHIWIEWLRRSLAGHPHSDDVVINRRREEGQIFLAVWLDNS